MSADDPTSAPRSSWRTFGRLLGFLRPYRASLIVSTVLAIASQVAGILVPVLTGVVINEIDGNPDTQVLVLEIAAIVALGLIRGALMYGRRVISGRQALAVEYDLRDALYSHFLRLSFGFYDRSQTGQLMSRATIDLQSVRFFLGYGLIFFAQHVVTIVVVTAVLFVYSWQLALVALAITPVIAGVAYRYSHVSQPVLRDVQQTLGEVATVAEESITGVHVVKSFAQEEGGPRASRSPRTPSSRRPSPRTDSARSTCRYSRSCRSSRRLSCCSRPGAWWSPGSLSLGAFFTFNLLLAMLVMPLRMLGMWIGQAQRAIAAGDRIFEILDEPEEVADAPDAQPLPAGSGEVVFDDVSFGYDPERLVLDGIELRIPAGRTVALIGRTGSGKTTLATLVPRFYDVSSGRVLVDGVDIRQLQRRSLRREIGVISQDPFLFSASIRDNIALGMPDAPLEAVEAAARAAQAHDFVLELPHGYDTVVGERGITLSGASVSGSRSRARCSSTRGFSSSTTRRLRSTRRRRRRSAPDCARSHATGRRSSSPTGSRRSRSRTR